VIFSTGGYSITQQDNTNLKYSSQGKKEYPMKKAYDIAGLAITGWGEGDLKRRFFF
jgi:hypothetical protein